MERGSNRHSRVPGPAGEDEPDLMGEARARLATGEPMDLLAQVSNLVEVLAPPRSPLGERRGPRSGGTPGLREMIPILGEVDLPEAAALLAGFAHLAPNELLRAQARRALVARRAGLPQWLAQMGEARANETLSFGDVFGDGEAILVGVTFAGERDMTAVLYVDLNLGSVANNGFAAPGLPGSVKKFIQARSRPPREEVWTELGPADARARIEQAIDHGAVTYPRIETNTWPAARPLLQWVARLLPVGGTGYQRPQWSDAGKDELARSFLASKFGARFDDPASRGLLDHLLCFGTDSGPGDPLRWSPVAVETLFAGWASRKIVADPGLLSQVPDLLRAFIRYSHAERGMRAGLTEDTLRAVGSWEELVLPREEEDEAFDPGRWTRGFLAGAVGGTEALAGLDDRPLPDEEFRWAGVPADVRPAVEQVLELCDGCCDALLDVEYRTACRRLLARLATIGPEVFRRRGRPETAAAALCWIIGKANYAFSARAGDLRIGGLLEHFGLAQASVSRRAKTLLEAAGFDSTHFSYLCTLGAPELLVSARRQVLVASRDRHR